MQIQSRVSTIVTLNQSEIEEAIIEFIKARAPEVPANANFKIEFEDAPEGGDLTAEVSIDALISSAAPEKTKQTRTPRTPKAIVEADKPVEPQTSTPPAEPPVEEPGETTPAISSEPEDRKDPANPDPPFDPDTPPASATPKIFQNVANSAPPTPAPPPPDPVVAAKSLFANLGKPN